MSSTVETEPTLRPTGSQPQPWIRVAALTLVGALAFFGIVLLAYELAVARVPQHRAVLERLVRGQTGLDIRFDELGLRWGWYGPEAVFRRVELGEPGRSTVLLRAPELVVGFDVWQTVRTGQLAAGRITLVAADINFGERVAPTGAERRAMANGGRHAAGTGTEAAQVLGHWKGGRVDLEGGTLRLPDPTGSANPLTLQIRRASLRRSTSEWSGYGLVFLPERLGRTARVVMSLDGDLEKPAELSGTVRFEGRRLAFGAWRDLLSSLVDTKGYLPRGGGGDIEFEVDFARGHLVKASGKVSAGGVQFAASSDSAQPVFDLDHVKGEWRLAHRASGWRLQVDSLELGETTSSQSGWPMGLPGSLSLEAAARGDWVRGTLEQAPLRSVAALARWFAPRLDLSDAGLGGSVHNVMFEWNGERPVGHRLRATARLADVSITSSDFSLTGLAGHVSGDETDLVTELESRTAHLELAQARQYPLDDVHVDARLQINREPDTWRVTTDHFELQHGGARLKAQGSLSGNGSGAAPEIDARADLVGVDVPLLKRLTGDSMTRAFGAALSQLTAGNIERAQFELHGPVDETLLHTGLTGELAVQNAVLSGGGLWPDVRDVFAHVEWRGSRIRAVLDGAQLQAVAGIPPIDDLRGTLVFDGGDLRRSTLTGSWLGGPVTLNVGERHERGALVLSIQGRGLLDARQLSLLATAGTVIDQTRTPTGRAEWTGELAYQEGSDAKPTQWRVRADSSLMGIVSHLPEPLAKTGAAVLPLHVDAQGTAETAELHLALGDHLRSVLALERRDDATWKVDRGNVQFGSAPATLPATPVVLVEGRVGKLDLPAYVAAWQELRAEPSTPPIRADLLAAEMLVAGHSYSAVKVSAARTGAGADLQLQSAEILGTAHWPAITNTGHPARFHFAKLNIPDGSAFAASAELIAALGPATGFSVDDIIWEGHSIGSAAATIESGGNVVNISDLRLTGRTQDVSGTMRCQGTACRFKFTLDSTNAAATLEDFGFRPELAAAKATLDGDLEWRVGADQPPLATLAGQLDMHLEDGTTRARSGPADPDPDPDSQGTPFPLLLVPALVSGMGQPSAQTPLLASSEPGGLRFTSLEARFEVSHGVATTSNLHFDGDAEILMRGRTSLLARDYDQQVWILRGEGRLPAAVRRLGPTPRVAAAWLSLRELFTGSGRDEGSKAQLHLQGTWDDPIVVAAE
jgi:uncharacterized protein YhdP